MNYEVFNKIRKKSRRVMEELLDEQLKRSWFVCFMLTEDSRTAAPLLIKVWENAVNKIAALSSPPSESFKDILFSELLLLSENIPEPDEDFESIAEPELLPEHEPFKEEIRFVAHERRAVYLASVLCDMGKLKICKLMNIGEGDFDKLMRAAQNDIDTHASKGSGSKEKVRRMKYFAEFKSPDGSGFKSIELPEILTAKLNKALNADYKVKKTPSEAAGDTAKNTAKAERKESKVMPNKQKTQPQAKKSKPQEAPERRTPKKKSKKKAIIIAAVSVGVIALAAAIIIPNIVRTLSVSAASTTTYNVEAVTTGDVDTTISGSGTLTPISSDTLSKNYPVTVTELKYSVGDEIEADAVIAVVESDSKGSENITAPYDCVLIEQPVAADDEVEAQGEIAMVMGKDGYTMSISVDELNITAIKTEQEVSFSIDAVSGEQTGTVSAVSYNGKTSGSSSSYEVTAKLDYIEGVYPGMSATAEIVIESSGEGLLVPVEAVKTSGDDSYVYLAPSDAEDGGEYSEGEIDLDSLEKVTVETGMSDGTYIIIESDDIKDGDLIIVETKTSTQTSSDSDSSDSGFGGGFGGGDFGGGFSGGGGMEISGFDPGNMPQGGGDMPGSSD